MYILCTLYCVNDLKIRKTTDGNIEVYATAEYGFEGVRALHGGLSWSSHFLICPWLANSKIEKSKEKKDHKSHQNSCAVFQDF